MRISIPEQAIRGLVALMLIWKLPEVYWTGIIVGVVVLLWHARQSRNAKPEEPIPVRV
jgi:hypothetical protein